VQMPYWDPEQRISRPAEIDIFITETALVTAHRGELKALSEHIAQVEADPTALQAFTRYGAGGLLYSLLNHLVDHCFPMVRKIALKLRAAEEQLFTDNTRDLLREVMVLRRDIITMRAILHAQAEIVQDLLRTHWPLIPDELDPYWGDLNDHLRQLVTALDQYAEMVSGLSESIDTLASHRIDEVVRLLTVATVLTLPITLLTTFFGMNILLPYGDHPAMFIVVSLVAFGSTVWLIWYLRKKKWL